METRSSYRLSSHLVLGLIVVLLGVIFTLDNLGLLYAGDYLKYWPALLLAYGIWKIATCATPSGRGWGIFWAFVGAILLLHNLDMVYVTIWDLWPLILVLIGTNLILGSRRQHRREFAAGAEVRTGDSNSTIGGFALLGAFKRTNDSQDFRGGEATAIMGACELDLRQASINDGDAILDLFAFWGGVEVKVPEDWTVILQGVPILGGFEDKTRPPKAESKKRLIIKGYAVMGGVEIKN
jgi:predicted membrane protein